jgi:hypothetical protein
MLTPNHKYVEDGNKDVLQDIVDRGVCKLCVIRKLTIFKIQL